MAASLIAHRSIGGTRVIVRCRKYLWKTSSGSRVSGSGVPSATLWARECITIVLWAINRVFYIASIFIVMLLEKGTCEVDFSKLEWTFLWREIKQDSEKERNGAPFGRVLLRSVSTGNYASIGLQNWQLTALLNRVSKEGESSVWKLSLLLFHFEYELQCRTNDLRSSVCGHPWIFWQLTAYSYHLYLRHILRNSPSILYLPQFSQELTYKKLINIVFLPVDWSPF